MNSVCRLVAVAALTACIPLGQAVAASDTPTPGLLDRIWSALLAPAPTPARHVVHAATHDTGRAATRVQAASAHETPGHAAPRPGDQQMAAMRPKPVVHAVALSSDTPSPLLRNAAYQQAAACDSLLCSSYAIIGVGF